MKSISVKCDNLDEVLEAIRFLKKNQTKIKKSKAILEEFNSKVKNKVPELNGVYQIKVGKNVIGVDIVSEKTIFDQKSLREEQPEAFKSYMIDTTVHTIKLEA